MKPKAVIFQEVVFHFIETPIENKYTSNLNGRRSLNAVSHWNWSGEMKTVALLVGKDSAAL